MKFIKNKLGNRKFELTFVFLTLLIAGLMKIVIMTASPVSAEDLPSFPSLFYNDKYYVNSMPGNSTYMPLEIIDGVYYVPYDLFRWLNCEMESRDNYKNIFYIKYGNNYININVSAGKTEIYSENMFYDNILCEVKFIRGTTYVPAAIFANYLGLKWEDDEQYKVLRIKDPTIAKKSFDELLEPYIKKIQTTPQPEIITATSPQPVTTAPWYAATVPSVIAPPVNKTEPTTTDHNVQTYTNTTEPTTRGGNNIPKETNTNTETETTTQPPTTTAEPTTAENTQEIENHLIFYDSREYPIEESTEPAETSETEEIDKIEEINRLYKIEEVLDVLDNNGITATFFLSGSEIIANPDILRKIYSSGHNLGIKVDDVNNLISELEETNALIYSTVKHKTRFCIFNENIEMSESYENQLKANGYYLCRRTAGVSDLTSITDTNEMIDFMKQQTVNVFIFDLNDLTNSYINYIDLSAQADKAKFYIKFSYINNANIEKIKQSEK